MSKSRESRAIHLALANEPQHIFPEKTARMCQPDDPCLDHINAAAKKYADANLKGVLEAPLATVLVVLLEVLSGMPVLAHQLKQHCEKQCPHLKSAGGPVYSAENLALLYMLVGGPEARIFLQPCQNSFVITVEGSMNKVGMLQLKDAPNDPLFKKKLALLFALSRQVTYRTGSHVNREKLPKLFVFEGNGTQWSMLQTQVEKS